MWTRCRRPCATWPPRVRPAAGLFRELELLSRCSTRVLIPTANTQIEDGPRTSGTSTWAEFLSAVVGTNGAAQNFDGNGFMLRGHPGGGATPVTTGDTRWMRSRSTETRSRRPRARVLPPRASCRRTGRASACHRNAAPDLNGPAAAVGSGRRERRMRRVVLRVRRTDEERARDAWRGGARTAGGGLHHRPPERAVPGLAADLRRRHIRRPGRSCRPRRA